MTYSSDRRRRLLWMALAFVVAASLLGGLVASRRSAPAALDWEELGPEDPRVAGIFAALEHEGLQVAMDSLVRQAAADSVVLRGGHQLAHALGRRSLAGEGGGSPGGAPNRAGLGGGGFFP